MWMELLHLETPLPLRQKSSMMFDVLLPLIFATSHHYWTVNTHPNSTTHNVVFFHSTMLSFPFYTQRIIRLQIPFIRTFKFGIIPTSLYMFIELSRQDIGDAKFRGKKKKHSMVWSKHERTRHKKNGGRRSGATIEYRI